MVVVVAALVLAATACARPELACQSEQPVASAPQWQRADLALASDELVLAATWQGEDGGLTGALFRRPAASEAEFARVALSGRDGCDLAPVAVRAIDGPTGPRLFVVNLHEGTDAGDCVMTPLAAGNSTGQVASIERYRMVDGAVTFERRYWSRGLDMVADLAVTDDGHLFVTNLPFRSETDVEEDFWYSRRTGAVLHYSPLRDGWTVELDGLRDPMALAVDSERDELWLATRGVVRRYAIDPLSRAVDPRPQRGQVFLGRSRLAIDASEADAAGRRWLLTQGSLRAAALEHYTAMAPARVWAEVDRRRPGPGRRVVVRRDGALSLARVERGLIIAGNGGVASCRIVP